jgi:hypothetical protein
VAKFAKAVRTQARARVAIDGPAKAGKSLTALRLAVALAGESGTIAAIDTEFGSLSKYAGRDAGDHRPLDFDVMELSRFSPEEYIAGIRDAVDGGYAVVVIDSLSHAWVGQGGILDQKDKMSGAFSDWAKLTPQHRRLVDSILGAPIHVVATMRSKTDYVLEKDAKGKTVPRKVGLAPVQREGMEYEFDLLCSLDADHVLTVSGSRCPELDGATASKPGAAFFAPYVAWLGCGVAPQPPAPAPDPAELAPLALVHTIDTLLHRSERTWGAALRHLRVELPPDWREPADATELANVSDVLPLAAANKLLAILGGKPAA